MTVPRSSAYWQSRCRQAKKELTVLITRQNHKMTPKSRAKISKKIHRLKKQVLLFTDYANGTKVPPQPKEKKPMSSDAPRLIEIGHAGDPWRLMINANDIRSMQFLPVMEQNEEGQLLYKSFTVNLNVAGHMHNLPFDKASAAQNFYEYIKAQLIEMGITVFGIPPMPLSPPAANETDESVQEEPADQPAEPQNEKKEDSHGSVTPLHTRSSVAPEADPAAAISPDGDLPTS